jgi:hypothetical protein
MNIHLKTWQWVVLTLVLLFVFWLLLAGVIGGHVSHSG